MTQAVVGAVGTLAGGKSRPASDRLESELKREIKQKGLVVWLDVDANYVEFAEGLAARSDEGSFPFPVLRFDGSFLELMLKLEKFGNGLHPEKVLIHMPGFNEQSIAETPLYELFKAGKRHRKALDTLLEEACVGIVRPEKGVEFRATKPTLEEADLWLRNAQAGEKDHFLVSL